jgi:hypothetical protein
LLLLFATRDPNHRPFPSDLVADQLPVEYGGTCSLNCAVRKSGATAQCCVPTMTEAELWAYAMVWPAGGRDEIYIWVMAVSQ